MGSEGDEQDDTNLTPQLGLAYHINDSLKIRANYTEAFKMPSAEQLASGYDGWAGVKYIGNANLEPETSKTYEIGFEYSRSRLDASLTYFSTDFDDKIETATLLSGDRTWENVDSAKLEGIETQVSYRLLPSEANWQLRPYLNLVRMLDYRDRRSDDYLTYTSDLNVSYGVTASHADGFRCKLNFAYTGEQEVDNWNGMYRGTPPVIEKGGFTVANLSLSQELQLSDKVGPTTLSFEVQNLFAKDYSYVRGYPMPGRTFYMGLKQAF